MKSLISFSRAGLPPARRQPLSFLYTQAFSLCFRSLLLVIFRTMSARSTPNRRLQSQYLVSYNLVCAVLWAAVLGRVVLLIPLVGFGNVHGGVGEFTKWAQTLALLEVGHSALGMVTQSSPLFLLFFPSRFIVLQLSKAAHQALSVPPSSRPLCKSPLASSWSGPLSTATPQPRHPPLSTAPCCLPGPSQRSSDTAFLCGICRGRTYQVL